MADGKTLTWRKFPRDTITNPALLFIAKKLPKERQHQVFTLFVALYCNADDDGVVDLSDLAVFSYTCIMSEDDLVDLLYRFLDRHIIEEITISGVPAYRIAGWLDPYPGRMTAAEKQAAYRSRIAEKKPPEKRSFLGSKGRQAPPAENPIDTPKPDVSDDTDAIYDEAGELSDNEILALFLRLEKEDETEAPIKIVEPPESVAAETPKSVTERYLDVTGVTQEKEPVTGVTGEKNEVTAENRSVTERYPTPLKTEETDRRDRDRQREGEERETEEREMRDRETERETDRGEIDVEDTEQKKRKGRKRKDKTHTDRAGSPARAPTEEILKEKEAEEKETEEPPEREREPAPEPAAVAEDAKKTKREAERRRACFKILWKFFNDKNPMGFVDEEAELLACAELAKMIVKLEDDKNNAEIIACQFTNSFNRLLNKGGYFENMPCTPVMLLKPGNYSKVFYSVSKILHPKDQGGMHWAAELKKVMDNEL
ncbi:hypothetical protein [Treponema denticola]|uniref:hypothetical protein n=1 Tax=Treponema denticola TaxID=158 RepID=UPI0020A5A492|nr:hypothetical protein [Treponema denticola]UTC93056.1 hypothetical protein E4N84_08115 [Treponema denticola]